MFKTLREIQQSEDHPFFTFGPFKTPIVNPLISSIAIKGSEKRVSMVIKIQNIELAKVFTSVTDNHYKIF